MEARCDDPKTFDRCQFALAPVFLIAALHGPVSLGPHASVRDGLSRTAARSHQRFARADVVSGVSVIEAADHRGAEWIGPGSPAPLPAACSNTAQSFLLGHLAQRHLEARRLAMPHSRRLHPGDGVEIGHGLPAFSPRVMATGLRLVIVDEYDMGLAARLRGRRLDDDAVGGAGDRDADLQPLPAFCMPASARSSSSRRAPFMWARPLTTACGV